jgi:hypothetical protein
MRIHLITYATPRFRHRQMILGWSARLNGVVNTVTAWTPDKLLQAGYEQEFQDIRLTERGSGFWTWKPFIIHQKLEQVADGDMVFYCDVGRRYPFKKLTGSILPYTTWMENNHQDIMPGVNIPWKGPMSMWTKRDAFVLSEMDAPSVHQSIPMQASFSLWRAGEKARLIAGDWMKMCSERACVSDDPNICGVSNLPDYIDHRHDQSLLTLCCHKHGIRGLDLGNKMPTLDTQYPSEIATLMDKNYLNSQSLAGRLLSRIARPIEYLEERLRNLS